MIHKLLIGISQIQFAMGCLNLFDYPRKKSPRKLRLEDFSLWGKFVELCSCRTLVHIVALFSDFLAADIFIKGHFLINKAGRRDFQNAVGYRCC